MRKVTIEELDNGFVLITEDTWDEENPSLSRLVFENDEETREGFVGMLQEVAEYFGQIGSRYDKHRVRVKVFTEAGDKHIEPGTPIE